ncbi:23441_t:CDS:2, partial [Gigaspora margarita]
DSVFLATLKLKNFCIDDDVKEEVEKEVFKTQPQKRTKAQREVLRKRRESAAIFNRLDEDTSANFLSDNIDFSRTFFDDGFDDSLTANISTETAKNNTNTATEQLHITEKTKNSLAQFKEVISKFNVPLRPQTNVSCSTPKAKVSSLPILSSHDAVRSISHNLYSPIGVHRGTPLKDRGSLINLPDDVDNFVIRNSSSSSASTKGSRPKPFF